MPELIDGKAVSEKIKSELKAEIELMNAKGKKVCLAVIQVGEDPASTVYVGNKEKACKSLGIVSLMHKLPETITQEELLSLIENLNKDLTVNGILVQLPLPAHIDSGEIIKAIDVNKDVDGFHPENVGYLCTGKEGFVSCTPAGIMELLKHYNIDTVGKECVIAGRSNIVGKPMALLMLKGNSTVTITHSKTKDMKEVTKRADIFIAAIGKPKFFTGEYIKDGAVVIDVGMNRDENNKLCGDVDFNSVSGKASAITPVPGGVGPMTIAMLMYNCVKAAKRQYGAAFE
ncbi:MAG: bifunctional methylenetetrahydrofolate dehydrogenase/methenyltetrahydrofolate cyclohydrolase FolD [Lachnospiraceae bacterium]|jgi:methylenetetrahydrofolate dehydrogenase (NADP+)/methenyltetrahydrofolate cyclohydrolase|nr:bifunctional methylenetetrahydrofolate dehydrogenase/methenyltetrahydrofolate cyclohydrolase FolD [Lachnospiraceae bacterium]